MHIPLMPEAKISGALYKSGKPAPGVTIQVIRVDPETWKFAEEMAMLNTDAQGRFECDSLTANSYVLNCVGVCSYKLTLAPNEHRTVEVGRNYGPHSISGRVTYANGEPAHDAFFELIPKFDCPYDSFKAETDAAGNYQVDGLAAGAYKLDFRIHRGKAKPDPTEIVLSKDSVQDIVLTPEPE